MNIMMCLDGSAAATAMIPVCHRLAEVTQSKVHVVRVSPHSVSVEGEPWSGSEAVDIEKHAQAEEDNRMLQAELEDIARTLNAPTTVAVLNGMHVADELLHYATANAIDLIAIGCHERGEFHGGIGGRTTQRLARNASVPLLLGPMVALVHVNPQAISLGCFVFSKDGTYVGQVAELVTDRMRVTRGDADDIWLPLTDAASLSVASGLRLNVTALDLDSHSVEPPTVTG